MDKEKVLEVVTHTGDCYRLTTSTRTEPFNFYVSKIGESGLEQEDGGGLPYDYVSYNSILTVEAY